MEIFILIMLEIALIISVIFIIRSTIHNIKELKELQKDDKKD